MTTTWKINNYVFTLKESEGKIVLAAVDKNTKQAWETQETNEKVASTIIEGLFDDALSTLTDLIKDSLNNSPSLKYSLSLKVWGK